MQTTKQRKVRIERLIKAAELEAHQNPRIYNVKVAILALLGYVVIFGMLVLLISIIGSIGWAALEGISLQIFLAKKNIIFVVLVIIYVLVRALWVKFENPTGYELKENNFPLLFSELKSLSRKLQTPVIHQVIITPEHNTAILQTPRFGIFGWYKNTLFLGLELLMSMTPDQGRSVIAHELGHLSGKHNRFSGWIYRVRLSWQRIMDGLEQQDNFGANLMRRFFGWYTPTFAAYSFALARANEYNADEIAAKLTSNEDMAHALVNSHVVHDLLNEYYWQPFLEQDYDVSIADISPYSQMMSFLQQKCFEITALENTINRAMTIKTGYFDTHPALRDRLKALRCKPKKPGLVSQSAAQFWFDKRLPTIIKDFDREWLKRNASKWQERYQHIQKGRSKLAGLKAKPLQDLRPEELWKLASLTEKLAPDEDCLPLFELYSAKRPEDADADFKIGKLMLDRINEAGVEKMMLVMNKKPQLKLSACHSLIYYYRGRNDEHNANYWQQLAERQNDIDYAADKERKAISKNDQFIKPHKHLDIVYALFTRRIINIKGIKHAWLVEKRMRYYPESKTYVLAIEKGFFDKEDKLIKLISSQLEIKCPCFVILKGGNHRDIAKQVIKKGIELF